MRLRLDLSYDGTGFRGWAIQPGQRTVQGEFESALSTVLQLEKPATLTVAGRTDAGVHARGQVAHVDLDDVDPAELERLLRRLLPRDISLRALSIAPKGFDARFAALERRYIYRLCDSPAGPDPLHRSTIVRYARRLDVDAMNEAAEHLVGLHDFAAFCRKRVGATTRRTLLELHTRRTDDLLETSVRADAFCHSMVRSLMGVLVAIGEGRFPVSAAAEVLAGGVRDARLMVMPAKGLVLEEVIYPDDGGVPQRVREARQRRDA